MTLGERLRGTGYAAVLLWVNAYVCRNWFFHPTAQMNSVHGSWAAIARLGDGWLHPRWWPFWDFGIPFEFTSAPLVPAFAAVIAAVRHVPHLMAVQAVSAIFYCAAPVSLFLMAWILTRAPEYSFFAGLFYTLLSPAQILVPDGRFEWAKFLGPHRFMLQAVWDETPRCAALTFLLLFILFLVRSIERRGRVYPTLAALCLATAMLASPFAGLSAGIAALCLITVFQPEHRRRNLWYTAGIGVFALALSARYLPSSLWFALAAASATHEGWNLGVLKVFAGTVLVWLTLEHFLHRHSKDWKLPFFVLLACAMSCGPVLAKWFDQPVLPQAGRFRVEMEAAIALLAIFALRPLVERLPRPGKALLALGALSLAVPQIVHHRRLAKDVLYPADVTKTIEYRTAQRVARDLPAQRVMLPGSIAHWANAFTEIEQFSGSEGTMAYSQVQQRAMTEVYNGGKTPQEDARVSLAWLKAYGTSAVAVSGPESHEQWKPFDLPRKFNGVLPELWSEDGVTVYRVPQRSVSLAHVVPDAALVALLPVQKGDTAALDRYNAALDNPSLPEAAFAWQGRNHIQVSVPTISGQAISIQVSWHPGWHAVINGRPAMVHRDGLGMMWLHPDQTGPLTVDLHYDGGWELRLCRWFSVAALLAAGVLLTRGSRR